MVYPAGLPPHWTSTLNTPAYGWGVFPCADDMQNRNLAGTMAERDFSINKSAKNRRYRWLSLRARRSSRHASGLVQSARF
jgi:hypothetical protein